MGLAGARRTPLWPGLVTDFRSVHTLACALRIARAAVQAVRVQSKPDGIMATYLAIHQNSEVTFREIIYD